MCSEQKQNLEPTCSDVDLEKVLSIIGQDNERMGRLYLRHKASNIMTGHESIITILGLLEIYHQMGIQVPVQLIRLVLESKTIVSDVMKDIYYHIPCHMKSASHVEYDVNHDPIEELRDTLCDEFDYDNSKPNHIVSCKNNILVNKLNNIITVLNNINMCVGIQYTSNMDELRLTVITPDDVFIVSDTWMVTGITFDVKSGLRFHADIGLTNLMKNVHFF